MPYANLHPEIALLVTRPDGAIDSTMLINLQTVLSLDDMHDMLEMRDVHQSWSAATLKNNEPKTPPDGN